VLVVRGTKKLRDRVRAAPAGAGDVSTTLLGDWFATALFWKPQVALLVNERTLLPVFMPLAPAATLPDRELAAAVAADEQPQPSNVIQFPGSHRPDPALASVIRPSATGRIFQLKVTLQNIKPPVWRRILVDASSTLDQVHEVIQAAFGWWNYHLHEFEIDGTRYGDPDPDDDWGPPTVNERRVRLDTVVTAGSTFGYLYDFGDGWSHRVTVEKDLPAETGTTVPACIGGRRACPPEDCGGPWGYEHLLEALADPIHPEHRDLTDWLGAPFDPEAFNPADFVHRLHEGRFGALDD
jgi:hypothetical protein